MLAMLDERPRMALVDVELRRGRETIGLRTYQFPDTPLGRDGYLSTVAVLITEAEKLGLNVVENPPRFVGPSLN